MLIALIVILALLAAFLVAAAAWVYTFTFKRRDRDPSSTEQIFLGDFTPEQNERIRAGMEFIASEPHERVYTTSHDGLRLAASLYERGNKRVMLLFHGYRAPSAARDFSCAVEMYLGYGLDILLVDERAHGESEGKVITFGVKERRDVLTWIDFVKARYGEDVELYLGGISMGAATVMMAAGLDLPANVKGIVADCGYTTPGDIIASVAKQSFRIPRQLALPFVGAVSRLLCGFRLNECSSVESVAKSDVPILFIHGKSDTLVPCEMSVAAYDAARGPKRICLVDNAEHGVAFLVDPVRVEAELRAFLAEVVGSR